MADINNNELLSKRAFICSILAFGTCLISFGLLLIDQYSRELTPDGYETLAIKFLFFLPLNIAALVLSLYSLKNLLTINSLKGKSQQFSMALSSLVILLWVVLIIKLS
jgi:hypothetical protein